MTKRQNRMVLVAMLIIGAIAAIVFLFEALGNNTKYFFSPTEVVEGKSPEVRRFRIG